MADDIDRLRTQVDASIMRAALVVIQELHVKRKIVDGRTYLEFCGHCKYQWPCDTRKLADEGLDRMAQTNQGGA